MKYCNYNGKIQDENKSAVGFNNRGLRYGDGLFETIKCRNGALLFGNDHFERLWQGLDLLKIKLPAFFSIDRFRKEILELLKKNGHAELARVRLTIMRGDGGLFDEIESVPNYLIQSWELPHSTGQFNSNGLVLGIYYDARKSCDHFSNLKHNNFLPYVMASLFAKQNKYNDAIVLNTDGNICDTAIANIFIVKDEIIYTPSLDQGCIAGVMRKNIIQQLLSHSVKVVETTITVDALLKADEVFLSNSISNIRWVQSMNEKVYSSLFIEKIYSQFLATIF